MNTTRLSRWLMIGIGCIASACGGQVEDSELDTPNAEGVRRELVFVSNEDSANISVIDALAERVVSLIHTGGRPSSMRLSPDAEKLYVALGAANASADSGGVAVIDVATQQLERKLQPGVGIKNLDITPDGSQLLVSSAEQRELLVLDAHTGAIERRVHVPFEPSALAVRPDGAVTYLSSDNAVYVVAAGSQIATSIATGAAPSAIAFTNGGKQAYVANELDATLTIVDANSHTPKSVIDLDATTSGDIVPRPTDINIAPDGKTAYVSLGRNGGVAVIDIAQGRVVHSIRAVGPRPSAVGITSEQKLFVANGASNDVSVVDASSGSVLRRLRVGDAPWGIVIARPQSEVSHASQSSP